MKLELLSFLRVPGTLERLRLLESREQDGEIENGVLEGVDTGARFDIVDFVPRMVPASNYANNFGFQWNKFRKTQLDSHTGLPISRDQMLAYSKWDLSEMAGKRVLDVGCGAGRFAEIALDAGAEVVAIDYSTAVEACWHNHAGHPRLHVIQADIYNLPFVLGSFDYVYCFGVLQHTPDVAASFAALPPQLKPGGRLAVGLYPKTKLDLLWPKYWLRPITTRIDPVRLFKIVQAAVPVLLPVSRAVARIPGIGRRARYAVPVANHEPDWPLNPTQLREWALLNTYDMFSAQFDTPQSAATLRSWFELAHMKGISIERVGFLCGRGIRAADHDA